MTNQTQLSAIQFHNQTLITFEQNNVQYVAMRPICENIGLDWAAQYSRIKRDEVLNSTVVIITTVAEDSRNREMICLPIDYLNGWLFGIDIKRVKPEIRELLITYKQECYKALADYWIKGKAERVQPNPPLADIQTDEDVLALLIKLHGFGLQAREVQMKLHGTSLARQIENAIGGQYLHNFHYPLQQTLDTVKDYIQAKSERIMFVKGMLNLLEQPKALPHV